MTDRELPALRGGHWRDTGEGFISVDLPVLVDPAETPQDAARSQYIQHARMCEQCRSPYRCPRGNELWNAYTAP
jgi:hypothetical protein